jgi:hypothetical protein
MVVQDFRTNPYQDNLKIYSGYPEVDPTIHLQQKTVDHIYGVFSFETHKNKEGD